MFLTVLIYFSIALASASDIIPSANAPSTYSCKSLTSPFTFSAAFAASAASCNASSAFFIASSAKDFNLSCMDLLASSTAVLKSA